VVTATKRASNLQSVPVAVTALTAEAIQNQRINEFGDLTRAAASLTLTESTASPNNAIILRGIGTYAFSIGVEPSVAVIVDDVPVVQQAQAFDNLSDVERIEVLRGPQGTLFGKNASAGAINIVTRDTARHLEGNAAVTAATDGGYKAEASVAGPLSDAASYRVSGYYSSYEGNVRNLANGHLLNDNESWGIHGKLKYEVGSRLAVLLNAAYSRSHSDGTAAPLVYMDTSTGVTPKYNGVSILPALAGITPA
jgi:iron complex outermembrane receptor protein